MFSKQHRTDVDISVEPPRVMTSEEAQRIQPLVWEEVKDILSESVPVTREILKALQ